MNTQEIKKFKKEYKNKINSIFKFYENKKFITTKIDKIKIYA
jgi:hypothetical protein